MFTSCKNFLKGSDIIDELNTTLEYANASYVQVTIDASNSVVDSITPSAGVYNNSYKVTDTINLSIVPNASYKFVCWKVTPEDSADIKDKTSFATTVTIKKSDNPIVIEPVLQNRPKVISSLPAIGVFGIDCGSNIKVYFNEDMTESSIYWTAGELNAMGIEEAKYSDYKAVVYDIETDLWNEIKSETNEQYYYAYSDGEKLIYKNISIVNKDKKENGAYESLLQNGLFGCPYFETASCLIIPTERNKDRNPHSIPKNSNIMFTLDKSFESTKGIGIGSDFISNYMTGDSYDIEGPFFITTTDTYIQWYFSSRIQEIKEINYIQGQNATWEGWSPNLFDMIFNDNINNEDIYSNINYNMPTESYIKEVNSVEEIIQDNKLKILKSINFKSIAQFYDTDYNFYFCDNSGVEKIIYEFESVQNKIYRNQKQGIIRFSEQIASGNYSSKNWMNFLDESLEGIYKIRIYFFDSLGNKTKLRFRVKDYIQGTDECYPTDYIDLYGLIDNVCSISADEITFTQTDDSHATVKGPKGRYLWASVSSKDRTTFLESIDNGFEWTENNSVGITNPDTPSDISLVEVDSGGSYKVLCYCDFTGNIKAFTMSELQH